MVKQSARTLDPDLLLRVSKDTQQRMITGIFVYPFLWLIVGFGSGISRTHPQLFWSFAVLTFAATGLRYFHLHLLNLLPSARIRLWYWTLPWLTLTHSLSWGLLFAYSLVQSNTEFRLFMTFSAAGLVPGGTANFSTNRRMGLSFVLAMLVPALLAAAISRQWVMFLLLIVYTGFIIELALRQHREYWVSLENELELAKLSRTDTLTQLDNRRYFDEKLEQLCHLTSRRHDRLTIAIVDCDYFKRVNDTYGHDVGDLCLKHIASLLDNSLPRATDVCARFGGEEFSLILPGTDLAGARIVAERIRTVIAATPVMLEDHALHLTVSIGCVSRTVYRYEEDLPAQLFKQADIALYKAKDAGRNRCAYIGYDEAQQEYVLAEDEVPSPS